MNEELTQALRDEFPVLFGPNNYCDFLRGFGFECSDGWYQLIRKFALKCEEHNSKYPGSPVIALIVKEKFGGLRIQGLSNMTEELWDVLREVEEESYSVCDICGKPGKLYTDRYWRTACEEHK